MDGFGWDDEADRAEVGSAPMYRSPDRDSWESICPSVLFLRRSPRWSIDTSGLGTVELVGEEQMDSDALRREWRRRLTLIDAERLRPISVEKAMTLVDAALGAREHAYARYSDFAVGSAILCPDDKIFAGANVENASYGATMCAERVAAFGAVSHGCREFTAIAVVADLPHAIPPCGMCRQVLAEFSRRAPVIMASVHGHIEVRSVDELLPLAFEFP